MPSPTVASKSVVRGNSDRNFIEIQMKLIFCAPTLNALSCCLKVSTRRQIIRMEMGPQTLVKSPLFIAP